MSSTVNHEARSSRSGICTSISITEKMRERRSNDTTEANTGGFDVHRVYQAFVDALQEPDNSQSPIGTQDYINGYRELIK